MYETAHTFHSPSQISVYCFNFFVSSIPAFSSFLKSSSLIRAISFTFYFSTKSTESLLCDCFFQLAFPNDEDPPAEFCQLLCNVGIPLFVRRQFLLPKIRIRCRKFRPLATVMLMPKTTMNEYHGPILGEDDIRRTRQVPAVEAKTISHRMQKRTYELFRPGIPAFDARHNGTSFLRRKSIHNATIPMTAS